MNGAVMIETTFMGIATAFSYYLDDLTLFFLGNNSLKQEKSQNYNHYTHGNGRA
jgi:N-acetylneuraminic acid mutarotase